MKRARKAPDIPLTHLRLADLVRAPADGGNQRPVNLKVPATLMLQVHALARTLGTTKSATLVAVLNEGLHVARRRRAGRRA